MEFRRGLFRSAEPAPGALGRLNLPERRDLLKAMMLAILGIAGTAGKASAAMMTPSSASTGVLPSWIEQMQSLMPVADKLIARWGGTTLPGADRPDMNGSAAGRGRVWLCG